MTRNPKSSPEPSHLVSSIDELKSVNTYFNNGYSQADRDRPAAAVVVTGEVIRKVQTILARDDYLAKELRKLIEETT